VTHLGDLLTALADGQLSPAVTEKVLEHVAVCRPCAAELAAERRARQVLAQAECEVPRGLAARLRTIAEQPLPAEPARHPSLRTAALVSLGGVLGAGVLASALFVAGSPREVRPSFTDASALSTLGTAPDAPAAAAVVLGASRTDVPAGDFTVTSRSALARGELVQLAGHGGHVVLVTRAGRLDASAVAHLAPDEEGRYVLDEEPYHAVWQSGERVVELVTDLRPAQVLELVAHFPADELATGPLARIARGWSVVTGGTW